jgi:hypothetical protein
MFFCCIRVARPSTRRALTKLLFDIIVKYVMKTSRFGPFFGQVSERGKSLVLVGVPKVAFCAILKMLFYGISGDHFSNLFFLAKNREVHLF